MAREVGRRDLLAPRRHVEPGVRQPRAGIRGDVDLGEERGVVATALHKRGPRPQLIVHIHRPGAVVPLVHRDADALALGALLLERLV